MEDQKNQNDAEAENEKSFPRLRVFCSTLVLTLCVLFLGLGFIVVDYNTRRVGLGSSSMRIDVTTQEGRIMINLLGREKAVQVSENAQKWAGRAWNLLPPSIRTTFWIFEAEREATPYALEWTGAGSE